MDSQGKHGGIEDKRYKRVIDLQETQSGKKNRIAALFEINSSIRKGKRIK